MSTFQFNSSIIKELSKEWLEKKYQQENLGESRWPRKKLSFREIFPKVRTRTVVYPMEKTIQKGRRSGQDLYVAIRKQYYTPNVMCTIGAVGAGFWGLTDYRGTIT